MRIFKTKPFDRYARRAVIVDAALCQAVREAGQGNIDANLGGGVIKQRVARPDEGKSGGFRTIILFKIGDLAFFVYGFAKNARQNIGADELAGFKKLASVMFAYDEDILARVLQEGALIEVICDEEAI